MGDFLGGGDQGMLAELLLRNLSAGNATPAAPDPASAVAQALSKLQGFQPDQVQPVERDKTPLRSIGAALADALHMLGRGVGQPATHFAGSLSEAKDRKAYRDTQAQATNVGQRNQARIAGISAEVQNAINNESAARADTRLDRRLTREERIAKDAQKQAQAIADRSFNENVRQFDATLKQRQAELDAKPDRASKGSQQLTAQTIAEIEGLLGGGVDDMGNNLPALKAKLEAMPPEQRQAFIADTRDKISLLADRPLDSDGVAYIRRVYPRIEKILSQYETQIHDPATLKQTEGGSVSLPPAGAEPDVGLLGLQGDESLFDMTKRLIGAATGRPDVPRKLQGP